MKIALVIGNRPHFIKAAPFLKALQAYPECQPFIVHTGQHYDHRMSGAFLEGFHFPPVDINLEVGSGPIGVQTGLMLSRLDPAYRRLAPDWIVSMGDTNTTLAAALAAYQLHIPSAHIEAGMRENIWRPEEINKKMADHCADCLFAPIPRAVDNLRKEGISDARIFLTGDITLDTFMTNREAAIVHMDMVRARFDSLPRDFDLLTLHRAETVDHPDIVSEIISALQQWPIPLVFPVHPRTEKQLAAFGFDDVLNRATHIFRLPALPYLDFLSLILHARRVVTDSSGVLKEAVYAHKPCIVLDDTTEYRELFTCGAAVMAGRTRAGILATQQRISADPIPAVENAVGLFGDGTAAARMVRILMEKRGSVGV
ncbi:UDP-N-acetylglucosamine 2-epimerase (non-hydrolyzing) [bacterium]|nr:UDP-N-acetylglucosamine 2-epimerase (non-hydrolyzing) [candidate division CSSED10-310 bacterium]